MRFQTNDGGARTTGAATLQPAETLMTPFEASELIVVERGLSHAEARQAISNRIANGMRCHINELFVGNRNAMHFVSPSSTHWRDTAVSGLFDAINRSDPKVTSDWHNGNFTKRIEASGSDIVVVEIIGLSIAQRSLQKHFRLATAPPHLAPAISSAPVPRKTITELTSSGSLPLGLPNKGGRPAAKHGDAIATIAIKLFRLSDSELQRYTAQAVGAELIEIYKQLGEAAPAERNLETFAQGILRVLRASRI